MAELLVSRFENINPLFSDDSEKSKADSQLFAALMEAARAHVDDDQPKTLADAESRAVAGPEPALPMEKLDESSTDESAPEQAASDQGVGLPIRKKLTPEEELRLKWLQDQLQQCLISMAETPSEQTRQRIRALEKEISELTGVQTKSSLSKTAKNLTELDPDAKDEEEQRGKKMSGEMAQELGATPRPMDRSTSGPEIMNFYKQNLAAFLNKDIIS